MMTLVIEDTNLSEATKGTLVINGVQLLIAVEICEDGQWRDWKHYANPSVGNFKEIDSYLKTPDKHRIKSTQV